MGNRKIAFCEVCDGQVVRRDTRSGVESFLDVLGPAQPPAKVAIEAGRDAWHVHDVLTEWGNEVLLVDTTRSKQLGIGQHGRKTDRIDAEVLARAVEKGGLPKAHLLSDGRRDLRRRLAIRRALVEARASFIHTIRGLAREQGEKLPRCDAKSFLKRAQEADTSASFKKLVQPMLVTLQSMTEQLKETEQRLSEVCENEPVITRLCTAPGVGPLVAAVFVSVVDDAKRFRSAHQLQAYLGIVPSENSSGGKRRVGAITKKGNTYLRAMLVQSAWTIMRSTKTEDNMVSWAKEVAKRRGNRIAVIAVARKLAGILWAMWRHDTVYDPNPPQGGASHHPVTRQQDPKLAMESLELAARKRSGHFCPPKPSDAVNA